MNVFPAVGGACTCLELSCFESFFADLYVESSGQIWASALC